MIQDVAKTCANLWLVQEIKIAKPKVIVTLSDKQVYQRLRKIFDLTIPSKFGDVVGRPHKISIEGFETILFPMIHPDISRPIGDRKSETLASLSANSLELISFSL